MITSKNKIKLPPLEKEEEPLKFSSKKVNLKNII